MEQVSLDVLVSRAKTLRTNQKEFLGAIATNLDKPNQVLRQELGLKHDTFAQRLSTLYRKLELPRKMGLKYRRELLRQLWEALENPSPGEPPHARGEEDESADRPAQKPNGHGVEVQAEPPPSPAHEERGSPLAGASSFGPHGLSTSLVLPNPSTIKCIRVLSTNTREFEALCAQYILEGYRPEVMNEYQSLDRPELGLASVVFVLR